VRTFGIVAGLAAASIWGGMYVVSKVVLDVIPPFALISLRLLLGAGCLALILAGRGGFKAERRQFGGVVLVGVVGYGISLGLQFIGTKLSTAANGALVTSASPAFIFMFGAWLLSERVTWRRLTALILATLGVVAVIDPRKLTMGDQVFVGNVALLGAALTWGLYSVLVKKASLNLGTLEVSLLAFLGGLPISLPLSALEITTLGVGRITLPVIFGVLYLGLVSTALAMYLWNKSLAILDAGLVSLLFFAQPVVGVGLGAWLLKERLSIGFWAGAILIGLGLILSARADASTKSVIEQ
jgi:drug/metabolite transporter (DMT)-like permease